MSVFEKYFKAVGPKWRECKINNCEVKIKYESAKKHSSILRNHMNNKHSEVFEEPNAKIPKMTDYIVPSGSEDKYPNLPALDRQAIAACCSSHVIPYDIVEDDVFQLAYPCAIKSRKIAERVATIANEWRDVIKKEAEGMSLTIMLDGWTNSKSKKHHVCILLWNSSKIFYLLSKVLQTKTANDFKNLIEETLTSLSNARIVAAVADNARNIQGGLKMINAAHPRILAVKCGAHLLNHISGDVFKKIDIAADALKSLDTMVGQGLLARYSPVRWIARYESI